MEDYFRGDEMVLRWWRHMTSHAEDAAGLQRVALEAEESVQYGYLEAAAEPFERQVQLEAPFGAVPRVYGERFRDGTRKDKLKFFAPRSAGRRGCSRAWPSMFGPLPMVQQLKEFDGKRLQSFPLHQQLKRTFWSFNS